MADEDQKMTAPGEGGNSMPGVAGSCDDGVEPHMLQCMEIVGGNEFTQQAITSPGLDIWVDSRPLEGVGGDVHYFSMCGSGRVTRLALADISGHGPAMNELGLTLRKLMRKHINLLDQTDFAREINREFGERISDDYFATVLLMTYFSPTDHLLICNAGHPRPIWYSRQRDTWSLLCPELDERGPSIQEAKGTYRLSPLANLPIGVIEPTDYYQFSTKLGQGDMVLLYTDALIEAKNGEGVQLGEQGLVRLMGEIGPCDPQALAEAVINQVGQWRGSVEADDDQTIVTVYHNATEAPRVKLRGAVRTIAKMLGLVRV